MRFKKTLLIHKFQKYYPPHLLHLHCLRFNVGI
uniref:Uncharacterized protein n=1 Tax=Anguilla anguilla TaxID=7936 RepID=A0A0E9R801_ANGAN